MPFLRLADLTASSFWSGFEIAITQSFSPNEYETVFLIIAAALSAGITYSVMNKGNDLSLSGSYSMAG